VRELVDSTGAVRAQYDYDAWGNQTKLSGDLDARFGFTGHYYHARSGLDLTLHRAYDPSLGRWLSRDPLENAEMRQGPNLYSYVGNDPLSEIDLLGLARGDWWDPRTYLPDYDRARQIGLEELARHRGHNDADDAMRHAEWSRRMRCEIGPFTAWSSGVGHEIGDLFHGMPWSESMMDLHNNAEGRQAGSEGRPVDPGRLVTSPTNSSGPY
jgi:RHS repeat-associated protein